MKFSALLKNRPYLIFGGICLLLFLAFLYYFTFDLESTIAINVYDTYYVIACAHLFFVTSIWFSICSFGYWIFHRFKIPLIYWMTLLHLLFSVFLGVMVINTKPLENDALIMFWISLLIFGLGQITYLLNMILSIIFKGGIKN